MINYNGTLTENNQLLSIDNRGLAYGDSVFETLRVVNSNVVFWEDHYFRFMASMRIMRMEIPMDFTMEYLEDEILKTIEANGLQHKPARVKLVVFREGAGLYTPESNEVRFFISAKELERAVFSTEFDEYRADIFKDYPITPGLLSTLKTNTKVVNVIGGIYAKENELDNCILLNTNKQVVEALNGNIFLVQGSTIKTPPILDGCIKGVMRKQVMDLVRKSEDLTLEEVSISPFELQRADELFLTNIIMGIKPITAYRKKNYKTEVATRLIQELNKKVGI